MKARPRTRELAKRLRAELSPPELRLWLRLRASRSSGVRFRRQHPLGPYVLDFYCAPARLAVELDGFSHQTGERGERDRLKDHWLAEQGIRTVRIAAGEVLRDPDASLTRSYEWR